MLVESFRGRRWVVQALQQRASAFYPARPDANSERIQKEKENDYFGPFGRASLRCRTARGSVASPSEFVKCCRPAGAPARGARTAPPPTRATWLLGAGDPGCTCSVQAPSLQPCTAATIPVRH